MNSEISENIRFDIIEEEPLQLQEEEIVIEEEPVQEEDIVIEEEPLQLQEEDIVIEEEPLQLQEEEIVIEQEPEIVIEEEPLQLQEEEIVIEEEQVIEQEPVQLQEEEIVVEQEQEPEIVIEQEPFVQLNVPKLIFIVPYREREENLTYFREHMVEILEDMNPSDYKIFYIHQLDSRTFNRGAMKNIGFLYVKQMYPDTYKSITLVFNDVDTMPKSKNQLNYETVPGTVKHFYGYNFTLGGIVSITAGDFEKTNGFPNYWAWGYEDNAFQYRVLKSGLIIDRTTFYPILDKNIIQFNDTLDRIMNRREFHRFVDEYKYSNANDGFTTIYNLSYYPHLDFINVTEFKSAVEDSPSTNQTHNLKNGSTPFRIKQLRRGSMKMIL